MVVCAQYFSTPTLGAEVIGQRKIMALQNDHFFRDWPWELLQYLDSVLKKVYPCHGKAFNGYYYMSFKEGIFTIHAAKIQSWYYEIGSRVRNLPGNYGNELIEGRPIKGFKIEENNHGIQNIVLCFENPYKSEHDFTSEPTYNKIYPISMPMVEYWPPIEFFQPFRKQREKEITKWYKKMDKLREKNKLLSP